MLTFKNVMVNQPCCRTSRIEALKDFRSSETRTMDGVLVIQTGGTIDKDYPETIQGYAFEICEPAVTRILSRARSGINISYETVCRKDSQDVTDENRLKMAEKCRRTSHSHILITHGTDTMIDTAAFLAQQGLTDKKIVITGAFLPETFKNSDADFNVGVAFGALQCLTEPGIYIAMNGSVLHWSVCNRDPVTNMFTMN